MTGARAFDPLGVPLEGTALVTASAGTGKTHAITTLLLRLLVERDLEIGQVLVVTFTEAATAELRGRIGERLRAALWAFRQPASAGASGDAELDRYAAARRATSAQDAHKIERALRDLDQAAVSTIHGFCHRVLLEDAFDSGIELDVELVADMTPLRQQVLDDFWASEVLTAPETEVRAIERAGYRPSGCGPLLDAATRHATARLLPEQVRDPFVASIEQARGCFDAAEISCLLEQHPGLRGQASKLRRWVSSAAELLASPPTEPPAKLTAIALGIRKLASDELAKAYAGPAPAHPFFDACQSVVEAYRGYDIHNPAIIRFRKRLVEHLRRALPARRREAGVLSFEDLLWRLKAALDSESGPRLATHIRSRLRAALVDEFQDTDSVQFAIFEAIFGRAGLPLMLIGDPKQAIYAFRGADIFAFLRAAATVSGPRYTMGVNWRSDPRLIAAVSELYRPDERRRWPLLLEGIDFPEVTARPGATNAFAAAPPAVSAPLEILLVERQAKLTKTRLQELLPAAVAREIAGLLSGGSQLDGRPLHAGDIAVLVPTNEQCGAMQQALAALGIPAAVLTRESVFHSPEAAQLERLLAAAVEPNDGARLRTALATELVGGTAALLAELERDPALWEKWAGHFQRAHAIWSARGFVQMMRALMTDTAMQPQLLALQAGERRLTNLLHLVELCQAASREQHLGPAGLLAWLGAQRLSAQSSSEEIELRLETDRAAVTVSTIHKSKGLQYGVVYLPFAFAGKLLGKASKHALVFHDEAGHQCVDLGSVDWRRHRQRAEIDEALAESLRLLYVALTRARHRTTVVWTAVGDADTGALGYLLHPPPPPTGRPLCKADLKGRFDTLSDAELVAEIARRAERCHGAIGCRPLDLHAPGEPVALPATGGRSRSARTLEQPLATGWWSSSYSALTAGASRDALDDREGRDRDELASAQAVVGEPPEAQPSAAHDGRAGASTEDEQQVPLAHFPRGTRVGHFFHELLEVLDFQDDDAVEPLVCEQLRAHRLDPALAPVATAAVRELLHTPLGSNGDLWTLADVRPARRLNELAFRLPVGTACSHTGGAGAQPLRPARLAAALGTAPAGGMSRDYLARLATLRFSALNGYLEGYIDLVFEHAGRYFVADYKTNHLGERYHDYGPAPMHRAMSHGHYYLQAHLYALAVHRYLAQRLSRYTYERDFGGVLYLFIRGMSPRNTGRTGVLFERPPLSRLEALSAALDGTEEPAA